MKYELTGKDLPELYKDNQDPIFHIDESWELAKGDGWEARIEACGEIYIVDKDGNWVDVDDVIAKYDTDEKLNKAFERGELSYINNNWYEVEFFADINDSLEYLDLMADDCVVFDFNEAIKVFKDYMADETFKEDLAKEVAKIRENNQLTFDVEKEYVIGETYRYAVNSDGTREGDAYDVDSEDQVNKILIGFTVNVRRNDQELVDVEFYPIKSDMSQAPTLDDTCEYVYPNNEAEVLEKIKADFPAPKYQNPIW